jgi:diguanylate cyclase (GGDEF)-like protein
MFLVLVGDVLYMLVEAHLIQVESQLLDVPYALAYVATGVTALHYSMRSLTEPVPAQGLVASRARIAFVAIALVTPTLLTVQRTSTETSSRIVLFCIMLAMTITAVLRVVQALRTAQRSEASLIFQAHHDRLTGLPNRVMMEDHLSRLLRRKNQDGEVDDTHVAVLYLDLDRFKLINDTLGHSYGDQLLVEVAQRLRMHVRPTDLVTRIGGDEFMIVLDHVIGVSQALELTNRLRACLDTPFVISGMSFHISASIGLAFATGDDPDATAEVLIRDADTAMYQAKDAGRGAVAVFDESMRARVTERVELERDLREAVTEGQLHLVYQPIVRLPHGAAVGMEALVRWTHPTHGVISPAKFIPLAEDTGLITEIGTWVLEEAVAQLAEWRRSTPHLADLYVSVNLSGAQLYDAQLVERVADVLAVNGLEGSALCLELTESMVMEDHAAAVATLASLRALGVLLAIDDFGCEYSSLAYVKSFPVTELKIDRSFVSNLDADDTADATLIATIVAMARAMGMTTVAEGVETQAQLTHLIDLGCDKVQGYYFSRPVGSDRLPEVVTSLCAPRLQLVR